MCLVLCVCVGQGVRQVMCLSGSLLAGKMQRFNYAVIECDSLMTKGKMWGLIFSPGAVGFVEDGRRNRYPG